MPSATATKPAAHPNTHTHRHYCPANNYQLTSHTHTHPYAMHRQPNPLNNHQCKAAQEVEA